MSSINIGSINIGSNVLINKELINNMKIKISHKVPPPIMSNVIKSVITLKESGGWRGLCTDIEKHLFGDDTYYQLEATKKIREVLSEDREALLQELLHREIVPQLLLLITKEDSKSELILEALWALTNIAAGTTEYTNLLIKSGALPVLINLLKHPVDEIVEQTVWALGNIAGDGAIARDVVLAANVLTSLVACVTNSHRVSLIRIVTWTFSNLCDGQPRPTIDVTIFLPTLNNFLSETDTETLSHVCWALSHICDGPTSHIQHVVDLKICEKLIAFLSHTSWRVVKPALRAIGNIVCAEDEQDYTQHIVECHAVPVLKLLINHSVKDIQKEACWTLSNIAAGTMDQIQHVLDSDAIPILVGIASSPLIDNDVKNEACWVILNSTSCGNEAQIDKLVSQGCVNVLCDLLIDTNMVVMAMEGLEKILLAGDEISKRTGGPNPYAALINTSKIELLQKNKTSAVAKKASKIWKDHFVTCALCKLSYSKHTLETKFCPECKCSFCNKCDCSRFHLEYQDKLWSKETKEEKEKATKKSTKKQKKKKKLKDKKAANKALMSSSHSNTKGDDAVEASEEEEEEEEEIVTAILAPPEIKKIEPTSILHNNNNNNNNNNNVIINNNKNVIMMVNNNNSNNINNNNIKNNMNTNIIKNNIMNNHNNSHTNNNNNNNNNNTNYNVRGSLEGDGSSRRRRQRESKVIEKAVEEDVRKDGEAKISLFNDISSFPPMSSVSPFPIFPPKLPDIHTTSISSHIPNISSHTPSLSSLFADVRLKEKEKEESVMISPLSDSVGEKRHAHNDDLVSYLQQTGSILALAAMMEEEEDVSFLDEINMLHNIRET